MVFSTIIFLFRFLPITLALYYLAPAKLKNTVLFLCSLVFYCWGEVRFFPVMVALILINYISGLCIEHFDQKPALRRTFLLVALIGSLGMLFYFKYANFVLRSANALLGTAFAEIQGIGTLPLGISFYTFQTLSYSIDVYRRDVKAERNIIDFGAYVVMFPQLIAGPIVKYRDVSNQLHVYRHRYSLQQIEEGMTLFTFGLAKKVLLADAIGALWTDIIGVADSPSTTFVGLANASTPLVWLGKCNNGRYHFFGIALPPAGGVDAVTDIPAGAAVFDDGAACTNGLAGDFVFGNHIIAVRCVAQMPQQFHVLVQIVNGIQRSVGEIFPGDGVAPDAERKACIPRFLRAQPKPGCFKWCKIHCGSSFVFSSIDKNMIS